MSEPTIDWPSTEAEAQALALLQLYTATKGKSGDKPASILEALKWCASIHTETFGAACQRVVKMGATWPGWAEPSFADALASLCTALVRGEDTALVLTTYGGVAATKTIVRHPDGCIEKVGYGRARHFDVEAVSVAGISGLYDLLKSLAARPHSLVIRADPKPGCPMRHVRRQIHDHVGDDGTTEVAWFKAADPGRKWLCFDFDDLEPDFFMGEPPTDDDLVRAVKCARSKLPQEFHNAACVYRWSSSSGLVDWKKLSVHLWFWLSRPVACRSVRDWAEGQLIVDRALFSPAQAHYTADPIFVGGEDHLAGRRLGYLPGEPEVFPPASWLDYPDFMAAEEAQMQAAEEHRRALAASVTRDIDPASARDARERYAMHALEAACNRITASTKGTRHPNGMAEAFSIGQLVASGFLEYHRAASSLIAAIQSVVEDDRHEDEARSIHEGLQSGERFPRNLDHVGLKRDFLAPPATSPKRREEPDPDFTIQPNDPSDFAPPPESPLEAEVKIATAPPPPPVQGEGLKPFCAGYGEKAHINVADVAPQCPVEDHEVPYGYWMTRTATGVWKMSQQGVFTTVLICHAPVTIVARFVDVDFGKVLLMLAWRERGRWLRKAIPRGDALQKTKVVRLAEDSSFHVTSESAGMLAKYIGDYEAKNLAFIRSMSVASSFGWQAGRRGFLWGQTHIGMDGKVRIVDVDDETTWADDAIAFRSQEEGDAQIARAMRAEGSFIAWRDAIRLMDNFPHASLAIFASLASPLLTIVGCPNFSMDWGFQTSSGKTTLLMAAASCWGCPQEIVRTWAATRVWIERTLELLGNVPLFLDDTKRARNHDIITKTIYMVADGRGDGRGNTKRTDAVREWRTIMLSTGEQPATSFDTSGGTRPRCLEVVAPPFGGEDDGSAVIVKDLRMRTDEHFGHAGPRFVAWLAERKAKWPEWKAKYQDYMRVYMKAQSSGAEGRIAQGRALLTLCFELASEALGLDMRDPIGECWPGIADGVRDSAGASLALRHVANWFSSNRTHFHGTKNAREPHAGWIGAVTSVDGHKAVAFYEHTLTKFLEGIDYRAEAIYSAWHAKGWLIPGEGRNRMRKVRIDGFRARMVVFPMARFVSGYDSVNANEVPGIQSEDDSDGVE